MRVYLDLVRTSFKQSFAYRLDYALWIVSRVLWLFIQISVWQALFRNRATVDGISLSDMTNYVVLSMIVGSLAQSGLSGRLAWLVQQGSVSISLVRPLNLKLALMCEEIGESLTGTLVTALPVCAGAWAILGFRPPADPAMALTFLVSLVAGVVLSYNFDYLLGLLSFWLKDTHYVRWFGLAFYELFSGAMVPLWFYPRPLALASQYMPFRYVSFEPMAIYLGKTASGQALRVIGIQAVWIIIVIGLGRLVWMRAKRVITIHGG
jgi:ABC-2 type transport system permease protein